jgi:hypothetical protein
MEAILSKRSPQIENIYNKNLRPVASEQTRGNSASNNNSRRPSKDETTSRPPPPPQQQQITKEQQIAVEREKTSLVSMANFSLDGETDDDYQLVNSVGEYESACIALSIVPCSLVVKTLLTTSISLANYGFNSTGILALTHALKVNTIVSGKINNYQIKILNLFPNKSRIIQ